MAPKRPDSAQLALVDVDEPGRPAQRPGRRRTGRHERQFERAVKAVELDKRPASAAIVSAARALAWSLDTAEANGNAYAMAQLGRPYLEALTALGLADAPAPSGGDDDDPFGELRGPEVDDPEDTGTADPRP